MYMKIKHEILKDEKMKITQEEAYENQTRNTKTQKNNIEGGIRKSSTEYLNMEKYHHRRHIQIKYEILN